MSRETGKRNQRIAVDGVYDIETFSGWDKFAIGGIYTAKDGFESFDYRREDDFVDRLLSFKGQLWGHNAGKYDNLWFLSKIMDRGLTGKLFLAGQRIVTMEIGDLIIRDSAALIPMTLARASEMVDTPKSSLGLPCICQSERKCDGYCSILIDMPREHWSIVRDYHYKDCLSLFKTLDFLFDFADEVGIGLKSTVGSSSWNTAKQQLGLKPAPYKNRLGMYQFARKGYYGGRTQVFKPVSYSGMHYDINSAYPAALRNIDVPIGDPSECYFKNASAAFDSGLPGIYQVVIDVPDSFIPPLPVRTPDRITYPTGKLVGVWTGNELRFAISQGAKIREFARAVVWQREENVFKDFCNKFWDLRFKVGKKTALGEWLKWFLNSFTGKCAQHIDVDEIEIGSHNIGRCPNVPPCVCGDHWKPLDIRQRIWVRKSLRASACAHIEFAAYLTASTRVSLATQLMDDGSNGFESVYCDTDSIFSERSRLSNIGPDLGQFALEGEYAPFIQEDELGESEQPGMLILAPKTYRLKYGNSDKIICKAKGIPDPDINWNKLRTGVPINRGVNSLRSASHESSLFQRKNFERKIKADGIHFGDRILGRDGRTYPERIE